METDWKESEVVYDMPYMNRELIVTKNVVPYIGEYHCWYIELKEGEDEKYEDVGVVLGEEIAFKGKIEHFKHMRDSYFIGFDTAHYYNLEHPETKTFEYALRKATEIIKGMEAKENVERISS
jgi:hypothetical protein